MHTYAVSTIALGSRAGSNEWSVKKGDIWKADAMERKKPDMMT